MALRLFGGALILALGLAGYTVGAGTYYDALTVEELDGLLAN